MTPDLTVAQTRAVEVLSCESRLLAYDYGAGKSRIVLSVLPIVCHDDRAINAVVFVKGRTGVTWANQIIEWCDDTLVLHSVEELENWLDRCENGHSYRQSLYEHVVLVVSYDQAAAKCERLASCFKRCAPSMLVFDESTQIKQPRTRRASKIIELSAMLPSDTRRVALSGRPCPQHASELWSQFEAIRPGKNLLGKTYYEFLSRWFVKSEHSYALRLDLRESFAARVREMSITFTPEERAEHVRRLDHINASYFIERYTLTDKQNALIRKLQSTWSLPISDCSNESKYEYFDHGMAVWHKERQIYGGFYLSGDEKKVVEVERVPPKCERLLDILDTLFDEERSRHVVIWYYYQYERELLARVLRIEGYDFGDNVDQAVLGWFARRENKPKIMLIQCGHSSGLNELVSANVEIFYSTTYSVEDRLQAEARLIRPTQISNKVSIIDMCTELGPESRMISMLYSRDLTPQRLTAEINAYLKTGKVD